MLKRHTTTTLLIIGVLALIAAPVSAAPWDSGDNPFSSGVFADDWSPDSDDAPTPPEDDSGDDDESDSDGDQDDDSSDSDDSNSDDSDDSNSLREEIIDSFSGGIFDDDDDSSDSGDNQDDTGDSPDDGSDAPGDSPDDSWDDGSDGSDDNTGGSDPVSHEYVAQTWGGTTPWDGVQHNEDYCYTHFHRDAFDETHCGWDLDVEKPSENGETATEDRTLTEASAPESLGIEWISYSNPRDVMPNPYTAQDQPSFKLCTILLNQDNEPIVGNSVSDSQISMEIGGVPYAEAHPATFSLPLTQYSDMIGTNPDMPEGDGYLDSECFEFANLEPGEYSYSQPQVTGSSSNQIEFVGVTEYWDATGEGDPFNQRVHDFGSNDLSDGEATLDSGYENRHVEVVYVFRLN